MGNPPLAEFIRFFGWQGGCFSKSEIIPSPVHMKHPPEVSCGLV